MALTTEQDGATPSAGQTAGATPEAGQANQGAAKPEPPADYESWLKSQDPGVQGLVTGRLSALEGALRKERDRAGEFERRVKELAAKAEQGSELRTLLDKASADAAEARREADFYTRAHAAGVSDVRLAYLAATDAKLLRDDGSVDFTALKERVPALFTKQPTPPPPGNAAAGTQGPQALTGFGAMNQWMRRAASGR